MRVPPFRITVSLTIPVPITVLIFLEKPKFYEREAYAEHLKLELDPHRGAPLKMDRRQQLL